MIDIGRLLKTITTGEKCSDGWAGVQTLVDDLEDASNELMLADEEEVSKMWKCAAWRLRLSSVCALHVARTTGMPQGAKNITRLGSRCSNKSVSHCNWHPLVQVRYSIGDCFYHAAPDEAEGKLQEGKALMHAILDMYRRCVCLPEMRPARHCAALCTPHAPPPSSP